MRLIDADALLDAMDEVPKPNGDFTKDGFALVTDLDSAWLKGIVDAMASVELEPTVDAELVRHAHWIDKYDDGNWHCSVCGAIVEKDEQKRHNWYRCYHCGAKMDLKDHYCDRNKCLQMEYNGKGCVECEVTE